MALLLVWAIAAPVVEAFHDHGDDRCCRNGVCCCRPEDDPPGPCIRSVCRCAGHDAGPAGVQTICEALLPPSFRLSAPPVRRTLARPAAAVPAAGFARPPFHPPRLPLPRPG